MKSVVIMLVVAAGCMNPKPPVYHPDVIALVDTDSEKAIQVVSDERMKTHEPRPVPSSAVAAALSASGFFLDDDARVLAEPIASRMETMLPEEALRIVAWAEDAPRYYYVLIHNRRLQIIYYAGATQSDSYSAALPTDAVAITTPREQPAGETNPQPQPPVEAAPAPTATSPAQVAHKTPRPRRKQVASVQPISEEEARRRINELNEAHSAGLITQNELNTRRKEILARL